jgi:hypothetical protein
VATALAALATLAVLVLFAVLVPFAAPAPLPALAAEGDAARDDLLPLELSVPADVTLELLPQRLEFSLAPASIQTGIDCGMLDMCGIDPCLCGNPDAFGACACNGTHTTLPELSVRSVDAGQVKLLRLGSDWWLVPWGADGTSVELAARLPHHADAVVTVTVGVEAPFAPQLFYCAVLLALLAAVLYVVGRLLRGQDGRASDNVPKGQEGQVSDTMPKGQDGWACARVLPLLAALLVCALLVAPALALWGCAPSVTVTNASPRLVSATVSAQGDGSEAGQRAEVRLVFSKAIALDGDVLAGLNVALNDKPLDAEAITLGAALEGDDTLLLTLSPAPGAGDTAASHYFALYDSKLSVAAADAGGGVAQLVAADDGSANAALDASVELIIPSGLVIEPVAEEPGGAASLADAAATPNTTADVAAPDTPTDADAAPASATFRVVRVPVLRAVSWIEIEPGGARALVHNHEFTRFTDDDAGRAAYAQTLLEPLRRAFSSEYDISQKDDTITITARTATEGQTISPRVVEGVVDE